ncbi:hypothetical protein [uncultured Winogradskyella sp.]|uniref:hypothetical protein n=1 Tax=uncultured Winogradskyella sp. TaxID=395353 RepID=UPI00261252A8|nr:hypothetical protein [uncultured Winogradskyella sp.]
MKKISLCLLFFIVFFSNLHAQGGVDVKSISIDKIDSNYLNKDVKIEFCGTKKISIDSLFIREGWWTRYTEIVINDKSVDIVGYIGKGSDYWYYDKAYIELHNYKPNIAFRVSECFLREIKDDSVKFQWTIGEYTDKEGHSGINPETINLWINKSDISSILIRK